MDIIGIVGIISSIITIVEEIDKEQAKKLKDIKEFFMQFDQVIKKVKESVEESQRANGPLSIEKMEIYNSNIKSLKEKFEDLKYIGIDVDELTKLANKANINRTEIKELESKVKEAFNRAREAKNDRTLWTEYGNLKMELENKENNQTRLNNLSTEIKSLLNFYDELSSTSPDEILEKIKKELETNLSNNSGNTKFTNNNPQIDNNQQTHSTVQIDNTIKNILEIIPLLKDISTEMDSINNYVSQTAESTNALTEQAKKYNEEVKKREWEKQANAVADEVIAIYKNFYRAKKELELKSIDEQLEKEEERHNRVIDNLNDELDKYEESITTKLKLLDREEEEESFVKQLSNLQEERTQLQSNLGLLSLDDSMEAKFKLEELSKEIARKDEEIEELKAQRSKEIRRQNLQDQLDTYRKDVEEKIAAENNKYEAVRDSLNAQKEYWTNYYDEQINNEIRFAEIRRQIIQGNLADIKADLEQFKNEISDNDFKIGVNAANSKLDNIKTAKNKLAETKNSKPVETGNSSTNSKSWHADWMAERDLSEEQKKNKNYAIKVYGKEELRESLKQRVQNPEPGKTQQDILNYAESIGLALKYYHDGGTVGGSSFNPQTEEIAKLLKGEEIFSKQQLLKIPNILGNIMQYSLPELQKFNSPNNTVFNISLNIDKVTGDQDGGRMMFNEFVNLLKTNHGAAF